MERTATLEWDTWKVDTESIVLQIGSTWMSNGDGTNVVGVVTKKTALWNGPTREFVQA